MNDNINRRYILNSESTIVLDVREGIPIVLSIEPFIHSKVIHLQLHKEEIISALCCQLHQAAEAFTIPQCISNIEKVPCNSYFILTQNQKKEYTVFFCLSHLDVNSSLSGTADGLMLHLTSGTSKDANKLRNVFLCLKGKHLYQTIRNAMKLALVMTGGLGKLVEDKLAPPPWLDGLGWESGVAMGSSVSHVKIIESVSSLVKAGYPPSFVLIDEGWQHLELSSKNKKLMPALASFEADRERFPEGIKGIVTALQKLGIKHVGVWHGMMGYRGGIFPSLAKSYKLTKSSDGRYFLGADLGRTFQFFYDYYGYLRDNGVDFIKVGDQSSVQSYCSSELEATLLYKNLQSAMQAAASIQFNSAHFNTECLRNENLFYWGNSRIARAAEDIDISNPMGVMRAIRNNLTNSLWLQYLMQPDFDAWLTCTDQSELLAIFHALSGSINVIGDLIGEHNKELIAKFVLPSGHLLKADRPLTLCEKSVFCNPIEEKKIYKAFTLKGAHGIVGAFNLTSGKRTLHGTVSSKDVEGLSGDSFALFSHHNGFVKLVEADEEVAITLKPNQSDVLTFAPVHQGIAVLGGYSFFLAPGPILDINIEDDAMHISSMVATRLLIYCERQILEVRRNGKTIPWEYDYKRCTLSIDSRARISTGHAQYTIAFES